ncbi:map kinase [Apiospora arundinis]
MSNAAPIPGGPPPRYALYLLPSFSLPFKRRQVSPAIPCPSAPPAENSVPPLSSSPTSTLSSSVGSSSASSYTPSRLSFASSSNDYVPSVEDQPQPTSESPRLFKVHPDTIRCSTCSSDLAFASQIVSKGFTGRYGRAYLVSPPENDGKGGPGTGTLINVKVGKPESRLLVTGSHVVADITCNICHAKVGWKYVDAKEDNQKYKIGKYILETNRTVDFKHWNDGAAISGVPEFATAATRKAKKQLDAEPVIFDSEDEDECEDIFMGTWDPAVVAKRRARKVPQSSN